MIKYNHEEEMMLEELQALYHLPKVQNWSEEIADAYQDAAFDYEVIYGLDLDYQPTKKCKIILGIKDKLYDIFSN